MSRKFGPSAGWPVVAVLGTVWFLGCAGGQPKPPEPTGEWEVVVESDLDSLNTVYTDSYGAPPPTPGNPDADAELLASAEPAIGAAAVASETGDDPGEPREAEPAEEAVPTRDDFTFGYRVQLLATTSMDNAERAITKADSLFVTPLYLEYEPPFYKIRAGDFVSQAPADSVAVLARSYGYEGAHRVSTMILKPR